MSEALHSPSWYRVAALRAALRPHVEVHRHCYRGDAWYVLADRANGRHHRLSATAWFIVGLMDGERTMEGIWQTALSRLGDAAPTQHEVIRVLAQLHASDMFRCDVSPDALEVFDRHQRDRRAAWAQRARSPLAVRVRLLDPDALLVRALPLVRPLLTRAAAAIAVLLVSAAVLLAAAHWPELTADFSERALAPRNLLVLWLLYPLIKIVHELGHAFAVRHWGGEVHEAGVILLALVPMPYVDASASSAFRDKRRRIAVGAAGVAVELVLASLALLVWLAVEPGIVRTIAWNVMLIGGISTVAFNGNPLLRFDAYYVLSDLIEIPNLASRSNQHLAYLVERYLFGVRDARSPETGRGERAWFVAYGITAFAYRLFVIVAIVLVLAGRYPVLGAVFGLWALGAYAIWPLGRGVHHLLTGSRIANRRVRAMSISAGVAAGLAALVFVAPLPLATRAQGVVRVPDEGVIRTGADCFVMEVLAQTGTAVERDTPLVRCEDPLLSAEVLGLQASVRELDALQRARAAEDRVAAANLADRREALQAQLERARERQRALVVRSPSAGRLVLDHPDDLPGRFLAQGEPLGHVLDADRLTVRVVVGQADMGLVRERTRAVALRFAGQPGIAYPSEVVREVPAADDRLPSQALGSAGGGPVATDPLDEAGTRALEPFFLLDLTMPVSAATTLLGGRVQVRFDHGSEPLAWRWQRGVRRLLLGRLDG